MKKITLSVKEIKGIAQKSVGLLGKERPESIVLKTRFGIHTFGMKFPIDVVIVDKKNSVVKIAESLKPNKIFLWNPKFYTVFELPNGTIKEKKITLNDSIACDIISV